MRTELETKLQELEQHHVEQNRIKGRPEERSTTLRIVRECIALASLPQQDVGAGRSVPSEYVTCLAQDGCAREKARRIGMTTFPVECTCVPSPVGQAQQDSDVLGDAEGGPRAAGVPFAEDGGTGSSLAAPSPAIATEARQMMRGRADRAYCNYIDQMRRDECLGESAKFSTGKFGPKELAAHRNAAELLGAHKALYAILNEFPETPHPSKAGVLTEADAIAWMESKGMMWKGLAISTRDVTDHQLITMPDLLVRYVRDLNPEQ